jgi:hypothetical protein
MNVRSTAARAGGTTDAADTAPRGHADDGRPGALCARAAPRAGRRRCGIRRTS